MRETDWRVFATEKAMVYGLPGGEELTRDPGYLAYAVQLLGHSDLAEGLSEQQMARLVAACELRSYRSNEIVVQEYVGGDELFIVQTGELQVWVDPKLIGDQASPRRIATLREGQVGGELALIDGGVRSAQLRAGEQGVTLLVIKRDRLLDLCEQDTAFGYRVMRNLATALALRLRLTSLQAHSAE